ncbi:MAG: signal recognition particle-docking protein FtsY [Rickettsiales bacterium]|nr:MAG: signal recognition particle-docking protein FtsY [Rickettsiales bacterium]
MAGLLSRLKTALGKTSSKIGSSLDHLFIKKKLDDAALEELEDMLIFADVGVQVSAEIISLLRARKFDKEVEQDEIKQDLSVIIEQILERQDHQFELKQGLNVILVCGVNGNGKTTTIGKMAASYASAGKKVAIAACDTFRAAAVGQIETWAERSGARLFSGADKADPASVAHRAISESISSGVDILFIDTAGRLHNHKNLMDELAKIIRVIKKVDDSAPHHSLLVIDGTTGQNASVQVKEFKALADISGLVITKLDGTAKAGALVGIVQKFELPVHFIGIGEAADDLKKFVAKDFARALVGLSEEK